MSTSKKGSSRLIGGEILKPQGVRGELKLEPYTDNPSVFARIKEIFIENIGYKIEKLRYDNKFVYAKLLGVDDRDGAEGYRGKQFEIDRLPLKKDSFYIADLIGLKLSDGKETLGIISDIYQNGSADVYQIKGGKPFMFAAAEGVIERFDLENGIVFVSSEMLARVAVYED